MQKKRKSATWKVKNYRKICCFSLINKCVLLCLFIFLLVRMRSGGGIVGWWCLLTWLIGYFLLSSGKRQTNFLFNKIVAVNYILLTTIITRILLTIVIVGVEKTCNIKYNTFSNICQQLSKQQQYVMKHRNTLDNHSYYHHYVMILVKV